jgi:hypothetical protein
MKQIIFLVRFAGLIVCMMCFMDGCSDKPTDVRSTETPIQPPGEPVMDKEKAISIATTEFMRSGGHDWQNIKVERARLMGDQWWVTIAKVPEAKVPESVGRDVTVEIARNGHSIKIEGGL